MKKPEKKGKARKGGDGEVDTEGAADATPEARATLAPLAAAQAQPAAGYTYTERTSTLTEPPYMKPFLKPSRSDPTLLSSYGDELAALTKPLYNHAGAAGAVQQLAAQGSSTARTAALDTTQAGTAARAKV